MPGRPTLTVHQADPAARRRAIVVLVVVALAGAGGWLALERWLGSLRGLPPVEAVRMLSHALRWGSLLVAAVVACFAVFMWRTGRRVKAVGRFPLPEARTVRDVAVLEGAAARTRGTIVQALAVALGVAALAQYALVLVLLDRWVPGAA